MILSPGPRNHYRAIAAGSLAVQPVAARRGIFAQVDPALKILKFLPSSLHCSPLPSLGISVPKPCVFEFSKVFIKGGYRDTRARRLRC